MYRNDHRCRTCCYYDDFGKYCDKLQRGSIDKDFGRDCEHYKYNSSLEEEHLRWVARQEAIKAQQEAECERQRNSISEAQREWFAKTREMMRQDETQYYRDMGWMP